MICAKIEEWSIDFQPATSICLSDSDTHAFSVSGNFLEFYVPPGTTVLCGIGCAHKLLM